MHDSRLGDEIDDFCIKCKRLTNHAIVSLLNGNAAKVRCRTCYHDHDFRNGEPLPSKKDLKKQALFDQVLAGAGSPATEVPLAAVDGAAPVNGVDALPLIDAAVPVDGTVVTPGAIVAPASQEAESTTKKSRKGAKG